MFSIEEEQALRNYMLHASDMYFGLTSITGRALAFQYARILKKRVPNSWNKRRMAGIDWFASFMNRHPQLSRRRAQATSLARVSPFNRANVSAFFNLLLAAETRKANSAAKIEAVASKLLTVAAKKLAQANPSTAPIRVSKRCKTVHNYAEIENPEKD